MKNRDFNYSIIALTTALILLITNGCKKDFDELELAAYPNNSEVFIDGFSAGLSYAAFGGSKVTAFNVDEDVKYEGTASMKFEVPDVNDPEGAYAGGAYYTTFARDLSGYNALTFYAKASKSATLDIVGFGNDLGESKHLVSITGLKVNTNWKKYIIPIPDPSKLKEESGMFYYSEGPEDGEGYTFWIDEIKFEKLGTIAHKKPAIFEGNDVVETTVNGIKIPISGLSVSSNMPTGIDQSVIAAPSYYTFNSSDNNVATVDSLGMVSVISAGTAKITAKMGSEDAIGSLTVNSSGNFEHAPVPTKDSTKVISVFSNAYANAPVDYYNGYWAPYQTTLSADFTVDDDDVLFYTNFNFVGIQFTAPTIDASNMTHLHMDVYIPNEANPSNKLLVKIVDMGADGSLDGTDPTIEYEIPGPLESQKWISVDIDLSGLSSKDKLAQIIFDNVGSPLSGFYLDNVYFYGDGGGSATEPTEAAPSPPAREATDVISIYGDAYTNLEGTDYPDWGQTTVVSEVSVAGNNTLKFAGLNYQGIQLAASQDLSGMDYIHIDYWTANSNNLDVYLISNGPVEKGNALAVPTAGWSSVDIPLSNFSPVDLADVIQLKFDGNGDIYLDNMYFYKSGGGSTTEPSFAAPVPPSRDAADVISLFSNAYTNQTVDSWSADWDDSDVEDVQIAGVDVKKYTFTNFAGIDFSSNKFDASGMTHFHMDIWTPDEVLSKSFSIKNVDFGGGSAESTNFLLTVVHTPGGDVPALATGSWVSIDVPITAFNGDLTRSDLAQMVLTSNLGIVYIDNIYFYKSGGGSATEPATGAPAPPARDPGDVISIYGDAYTNLEGTDYPDWGQATVVSDVVIAGENTLKFTGLDFQGIQLASNQDVSGMGSIHIDFWTANSTDLNFFLISPGPAETAYALTVPTSGWSSIDIPLSSFSGVNLADVFQFKFDGNGDIYLDNIYFHKSGGGGGDTGPTVAAPTPTEDPANVVSIYSDTYTDIAFDNFDAGWCGGAAVTGVTVAGNNTLKKNAGIECHGIDFSSNRQDLSSYTHIHFDFYTDDTDLTGDVFNVKLVDFAGGGAEVSALEVNINTGTTPGIVAGTWVSVDVDITSLGGVVTNNLTRSDVAQIGITTANLTNVWYDNIYLYK